VNPTDIAIIGMAIRCPGAADLDEFWRNLCGGVESISTFAPDELEESTFLPVDRTDPRFVPAGGVLDGADLFDAPFFGVSKAEAELMDPQHRLFLECAWTAMEDSGHDLTRYDGTVATYAGCGSNTYAMSAMAGAGSRLRTYQGLIGNEKDHLATKVAYKLNLSGEAVSVQTACSTSLVAVHLACQSLLSGQSDIALAGGVSVQADQRSGYLYSEDAIFSPDGHCRAFDERAAGTVFGSGLGVVVLRPLADAIEHGDRVYAVIKGSLINNDAGAKVSYTAPSVDAQAAVVAGALEFAGVSAEDIGYLEAHGTGTALGDPIEIAALTQAFRQSTDSTGFCAIGSVKTNIGHLDAAAGVAGLIKASLALWHRRIPASLHFDRPNPAIDFASGPFYVNTALRDWTATGLRRAGVSSFGIGGTNAHVVLEEAPAPVEPDRADERAATVLTLSAKSESALRRLADRHVEHLTRNRGLALSDYCRTANTGRAALPHRLAVVGSSAPALVAALTAPKITGHARGSLSVVFQFTGQGAQHPGLALELYRAEPRFAEVVDECAELLAGYLDEPLTAYLRPDADLSRTMVAQPVLFAVEYALARLWMSWGVRPAAVLGHSLGEYVAACVAGVFSLADGLRLVAERGRLMHEANPDGLMVAVFAAEDVVGRALAPVRDQVSVAAVNGPANVVVSGDRAAVTELAGRFEAGGIRVRPLPGDFPFHSPLVEPVLSAFRSVVDGVRYAEPVIPLVSGRTGKPLMSLGADYWVAQLREPVRYADAVATAVDQGGDVFLEIGPHPTLSRIGARAVHDPTVLWVSSLERDVDDVTAMLSNAARLHVAGVPVDWAAVDGGTRRVVDVPTYPFTGERHWLAGERPVVAAPVAVGAGRVAEIEARLRQITADLLRTDPESVDPAARLLEVGLDSLVMIEAARVVEETYGIRLTVRQLMSELTTLTDIAVFLDARLPAEPEVVAVPPVPDDVSDLMAKQLNLVSEVIIRQLEVLRGKQTTPPEPEPPSTPTSFVPHRPITVVDGTSGPALTAFAEAYTRRTAGSKRLAGLHRPVLADNDNRVVSDFRLAIKEMVYPIAATNSRGARLTDVDGNEYLDVMMGYGSNLFGHSPDFITDAIRAQLDRGVHIGVQSDLAGRVAALLGELTGMARVAFCNSGSEAVMMALRLARTATGRSKVAMFAGSYHGIYDGTLGARRRLRPDLPPNPVAPGILQHMVDDLLVLDYDDPASLEVLRSRGSELAAILVEPVQSRRPDVRPTEFLRELRRIATESGATLVFDEIVTGLRTGPGGAQEWFGVRADLTTYGKVLGGGLPIGAVAGEGRFLDTIDGGVWNYGDDSAPTAETTFFAGTFCKHPLAMAAALAVLTELKRAGARLQDAVNRRVTTLADRLNAFFAAQDVPIEVTHFGSLFRFASTQDIHLLFYQLVHRGIHIREGHNSFLSAAHTDDDVDTIVRAVRDSVEAMRALGALPTGSSFAPTTAQRQLWTLANLAADASAAYNQISVLRLTGHLDTDALRRAVNAVVARHEALRTVFDADSGWQRVLPAVSIDVRVAHRSDEDAEAWLLRRHQRPFDLAEGPLLRCDVVLTGDGTALLGLSAHHIVVDGWSMGLLMAEISGHYSAERAGTPLALPEPEQFREYARHLAATDRSDYWTDRLRGPLPVLELPTDHRRPAVRSHRGARLAVRLDADLLKALRGLGARTGGTLFMVLLSAYQVLLHRLTGQREVIVGVPVAGRSRRGAEHVIGHCTNLVPLRAEVNRVAIGDLVRQAKTDLLDAYEHQDLPFGELVERLGIEVDPARTPLVAATFNLDREVPPPALAELVVEQVAVPASHAQFDLGLNAVESDGGLLLEFDHSTDLFDTTTIARWAKHFETLLRGIVATPDAPVVTLPLAWTGQAVARSSPYPDRSLHELFEEQVSRTPDAPCLTDAHGTATYRELADQADRVAGYLRAQGGSPGDVVAVRLGRSTRQVACVLGVLRLGAAYQPGADARLVLTDDLWSEIVEHDGLGESVSVDPGQLAYVLHTSGSSGAPKAVAGTHRAVVNRLHWMWTEYPFGPDEVCCQKTASTFVDSIAELFGPLLSGIRTVLLPDEATTDPLLLLRALAEHGVTRLVVVPSLLRVLLDTMASTGRRLPRLRYCSVSGEALPADLVARFADLVPRATLLNLYGSTEVMADATWSEGSTAIGRPIANTRVYLLDQYGGPVPLGVHGELYVAGAGVARGYLDDPAGTAERFVPDPFGEPGTRMYRTGDLARHLPDGNLEFVGRADRQVKIRGIRVEPAEVEAALDLQPSVRACAVVAKDSRLVAYVVGSAVDSLRDALVRELPDHLVPSEVVALDALPLTASGKVDRRALEAVPVAAREERTPPRTDVERAVHAIWSDVLGRADLDVHTRFFAVGGDSLAMMRLIPRVHQEFGVELGVAELFAAPTIAGMAAVVEGSAAGAPGDIIERHPRRDRGPLSFGQQRVWFMHQFTPRSPALNEHVVLRMTGPLDQAALTSSLDAVVARHDALRTRFVAVDGQPVQVVDEPSPVTIPVSANDDVEALVRVPFDLTTGPLLRPHLVRTGPDEHLFVLVVHHIVIDGWSLGVLAREVLNGYRGDPAPPELPVQYLDFARWQRVEDRTTAEDLAYWRGALDGAPALLELPTDRARPAEQTTAGSELEFRLPVDVTALCDRTDTTPFMVLLAAFQVLMSRYSGRLDICVGSPIANRVRPEVEDLIGFFVNTLVLRTDLTGDPGFAAVLDRVRTTTLGAFDHQALPFEQLVEHLRPERDASHPPLFQVMFILQNAPMPALAVADLAVAAVPVHNGTAKYDLTLELTPEPTGGYTGRIEYNTDLFDAGRIERLAGHLTVLLDAVLADPERSVAEIDIRTPLERRQIASWSRGVHPAAPADVLVHRVIEERAGRAPKRIAARHGDQVISYGELNRRANRAARALRERGVGPEDLVAVLANRGIDFLTTVLAILKSGAAYLPLDPNQPADRLTRVVRSSGSALVLADRPHPGAQDLAALLAEPGLESDLDVEPRSAGLAYVLYTSGSTGAPKGAMVEHHGMLNHIAAKLRDLDITESDVVAQNGPQSFDVSVWQMLAALTVGAAVEIFTDDVAHDPARLLAEVERRGVSVLQVVPAVLRGLIDEAAALGAGRPGLVGLRWMVPTGDALMAALSREWFGLYPHVPLLNTYGSTECSDDQCHIAITSAADLVDSPPIVSIGSPIGGITAHVLDHRLRRLPIGVPGELFTGDIGVGRGYLGDPRRTAEVFLPDPFSATPGARLYRTRDQVRLLADGTIEFLGRTDHLVKVRGFRIELGEIESALVRHPAVREAVVVARADGSGEKRLAAYVVPDLPDEDLRSFLRGHLPEYMVPGTVTGLDVFPLNTNGKVDRKALPEPPAATPAEAHVEPRSPSEKAVADIWRRVLGVDRVGVHDRFFDLGGHSLLATRVLARVRQSFDVDIPLRFVFEFDSVADLAAEIDRRAGAQDDLSALLDEVEHLSDAEVEALMRERGLA
jgi:amino acid adenylation domain-containing protein